jgi:hypothetical protein
MLDGEADLVIEITVQQLKQSNLLGCEAEFFILINFQGGLRVKWQWKECRRILGMHIGLSQDAQAARGELLRVLRLLRRVD